MRSAGLGKGDNKRSKWLKLRISLDNVIIICNETQKERDINRSHDVHIRRSINIYAYLLEQWTRSKYGTESVTLMFNHARLSEWTRQRNIKKGTLVGILLWAVLDRGDERSYHAHHRRRPISIAII